MWNGFWRYRYLLWNLVSRDFKLKYRRSVLGVVWSVLNPLLMCLVYWAVFSSLMDMRGSGIDEADAVQFAQWLVEDGVDSNICICCVRCNDFVIICSGFQITKADICIQIADIVGFCIWSYCLSGYQLVVAVINANRHALQVGRCGSDCSSNRNHVADLDIRNGYTAGYAQLIRCGGTAIRNGELLIDYDNICICCVRCNDFVVIRSGFQITNLIHPP